MVSVPILLSTVDRRAFTVRLTDFAAIGAKALPFPSATWERDGRWLFDSMGFQASMHNSYKGRLLVVVHTARRDNIRLISARRASK